MIGRRTAAHADGLCLGDVLGHGQELRNGLEGHPQIVLIQACDHHSAALVSKLLADSDKSGIEELRLIDANHTSVLLDRLQ